MKSYLRLIIFSLGCICTLGIQNSFADGEIRNYENRLTPISNPKPLLNDHPDFVAPVKETIRFEAPAVVDERDADLHVRAWRFSYNARGIIEMPNHLRAANTAALTSFQ